MIMISTKMSCNSIFQNIVGTDHTCTSHCSSIGCIIMLYEPVSGIGGILEVSKVGLL